MLATTSTTGYLEITGRFYATKVPKTALSGWLNIGLTATLLACAGVILASVALAVGPPMAVRGPSPTP